MNNRWIAPIGLMLVVAAIVALPAPAFAQVKVLMSNGFHAAYREILPNFEKRTGVSVTTSTGASQGDGPDTISAQLRRGVSADVVIMSKAGLTDLVTDGKIAAGTEVDLARSPLGLAVRAGNPKPDISTVEAFKQTLLRAKSITFQSVTVIYLRDKLLPQLGITENVMA
jgi:molybdate transport system substrate-binding protein